MAKEATNDEQAIILLARLAATSQTKLDSSNEIKEMYARNNTHYDQKLRELKEALKGFEKPMQMIAEMLLNLKSKTEWSETDETTLKGAIEVQLKLVELTK
jgi:predicted nucleic acid-binding protein